MSNFASMKNRILFLSFVLAYCSTLCAQSAIELTDGAGVIVPANNSNSKYTSFTIQNVSYTDSTSSECNLNFDIVVKSIGHKTKIGCFENPLGYQDYFLGYRLDDSPNMIGTFGDKIEIAKNDSISIHQSILLRPKDGGRTIYYKKTPLFFIPRYDGSIYEEKMRIARERELLAQKAKQDSIRNAHEQEYQVFEQRRVDLLTPKYYTNWIGASFFTIATVEKDLDVLPVRILDLTFFYDFGNCFVGMTANEKGVITQMTLRLYGDAAEDFLQKAIDFGYKVSGKGTNVNVRTNTWHLLPDIYDTKVIQYSKQTSNGKVYIEVSNSPRYAGEYEIAIFRTKK